MNAVAFERATRAMSLTPAGRRFTETAKDLLARLDAAVADLSAVTPAPLRLGWAWAGLGRHTVPLLHEWKRHHGEPIESSRPGAPLEALRRGKIDVALVRGSPPSRASLGGLKTVTVFTEQLVAAIAADDPLSRRGVVTLAELAVGPVAVCATAPTASVYLWGPAGCVPRTVTVANTEEWLARIAVGEAVGVTAEATTHNHRAPDVVYLSIEDAPPAEVILAWPTENPHPHAAVCADFTRTHIAQLIDTSTPLVLSADHGPSVL